MSATKKEANPFIASFKKLTGASTPAGHHMHGELFDQEKMVILGSVLLFFLYFVLEISMEGLRAGLYDTGSLGGFTSRLWEIIVIVWQKEIFPVFAIFDILLIFIGLYAIVRVWPMRQSIKLFGLKPHSHGAHGHSHGHAPSSVGHGIPGTPGFTPAAPAHAQTGNPATLKHWANIVHRANTGTIENLRWAVMEADALVDFVMKQRGIDGEGMAERLQNARWAGSKLIDKVFDAHRLRNELAHTPGYQLTSQHAERALFAFRDFLKELKEF